MDASQEIGLVDLETLIKIYEQLVQSHVSCRQMANRTRKGI